MMVAGVRANVEEAREVGGVFESATDPNTGMSRCDEMECVMMVRQTTSSLHQMQ